MANGLAVGGFAQGLAQGLQQGSNLVYQVDKANREQEAFEMDKKIKLNQIDEMERKTAMQNQIKADLQALNTNAAGGTTGGQATDEFGTQIGGLKYATPAEAKASGLKFEQGTTTEAPAMNDFQKNRATFEIFKKARIDHGFMDEDSWARSMDMTKKLKKEGIEDGFQSFLMNGDSNAAVKSFNDSGAIKAPKGTFLKREVDPQTGLVDVGVYVPGKDGTPQLLTTMNQYMLMTNSDALVKHYTDMKKSKFEQGEATKRTGMEVKGKVDAAIIGASAARGGTKDRVKERIDNIVFGMGKAVAGNQANAFKSDEYVAGLEQVAARAMQLMSEGKFNDEGAAVAYARKELKVKE